MLLEENKILCELVKQHPLLYDKDHKDYRQRMATDEAWEMIAESWGKSTHECKTRWRNIRTAYARSIGAYNTQHGRNHVRPNYLAGNLEFLRPHLTCRETAVDANPECLTSYIPCKNIFRSMKLKIKNPECLCLNCSAVDSKLNLYNFQKCGNKYFSI